MMTTLALTDGWTVGLVMTQMAFNCAMAIALFWSRQKVNRIDKLEHDLNDQTAELIDQRFGGLRAELKGGQAALVEQINAMGERLTRGDAWFERLRERERQNELGYMARIDELKTFIRENCASTESVNKIEERMRQVEITIARSLQRPENN